MLQCGNDKTIKQWSLDPEGVIGDEPMNTLLGKVRHTRDQPMNMLLGMVRLLGEPTSGHGETNGK